MEIKLIFMVEGKRIISITQQTKKSFLEVLGIIHRLLERLGNEEG